MDRVTEILPSGHETSRAASVLLDEFVLKVYLPQLEDKVSELFHHAVTSALLLRESLLVLAADYFYRLRRFPA